MTLPVAIAAAAFLVGVIVGEVLVVARHMWKCWGGEGYEKRREEDARRQNTPYGYGPGEVE